VWSGKCLSKFFPPPSAPFTQARSVALPAALERLSPVGGSTLTSFDCMLVGEGFEGVHVRLHNTSAP
jgi:hypothetical protein